MRVLVFAAVLAACDSRGAVVATTESTHAALPAPADPTSGCATVCGTMVRCIPSDRVNCERACVAAASQPRVAEILEQIVARCADVQDCQAFATCRIKVPARTIPAKGTLPGKIVDLYLPVADAVQRSYVDQFCAVGRAHRGQFAELMNAPSPPPDVQALKDLARLIKASDGRVEADLDAEVSDICGDLFP